MFVAQKALPLENLYPDFYPRNKPRKVEWERGSLARLSYGKLRTVIVRIGCYHWEIIEIEDPDGDEEGSCDFQKQVIHIHPDLCQERRSHVILHELLHAMMELAGFSDHKDEEAIVSRLAPLLHMVLHDNDLRFKEGKLTIGVRCPKHKLTPKKRQISRN